MDEKGASQEAHGAEGVITGPSWVGFRVTDDDVVEEIDVDIFDDSRRTRVI